MSLNRYLLAKIISGYIEARRERKISGHFMAYHYDRINELLHPCELMRKLAFLINMDIRCFLFLNFAMQLRIAETVNPLKPTSLLYSVEISSNIEKFVYVIVKTVSEEREYTYSDN
jgi:hypothetical protein